MDAFSDVDILGSLDSKANSNHLAAPLATSTPEDKRRISAPSSVTQGNATSRGSHKYSGKGQINMCMMEVHRAYSLQSADSFSVQYLS